MKEKLILIHHYDGVGGAGVSLLQTILLLRDHYDIEVFCPSEIEDMVLLIENTGVKVTKLKSGIGIIPYYSGGPKILSRTFFRSVVKTIKDGNYFRKVLQDRDSKVVMVNSMTLFWLGKIIKRSGKKSICFIRETLDGKRRFLNRIIIKSINKNFDYVFFLSEFDRRAFNNSNSSVIRNSVKDDYFVGLKRESACEITGISKETFNLLFVGGISALKGTHIILEAMKGLPKNIKLVVAGYCELENDKSDYALKIKNLVKAVGYDRVQFLGVQTNMIPVYCSTDILVFPSTKAHQARPVFEAGACSKTVIISNFEETREYVIENENGMTFEPLNSKDLAKKILFLYNNMEKMNEMGRQNRKYSEQYHSVKNVNEKLLSCLDDVYNL